MTNQIDFDEMKYRREDEEFREVRLRLRSAVRAAEVPPDLEASIRQLLQTSARSSAWSRSVMSIAAGIAVVMGAWLGYESAHARHIAGDGPGYEAALSSRVAPVLRAGLRQHIHCAVFGRRSPVQTRDLEEYEGVLAPLREQIPAPFQVIAAHKCRFQGRGFVHFTFQDGARLLSVVIARKREGESLVRAGLVPAWRQSGLPMYSAGAAPYQLAAFETRDHLTYVISDLPSGENTEIASAVAHVLRGMMAHLEG